MSRLELVLKQYDICEILGISREVLFTRIREGIYPEPEKLPNGRFKFTRSWLDTAIHNTHELRKAQLEVEKLRNESLNQRKRFERAIIDKL